MLEVFGSKQLYQWDTGRMAQVTVECDEVHFSNLKFGKAFVVDVVDGAVPIPDELLTVGENIYTWAYVGVAENGYTKQEQVLSVTKRAKPSDYVFTPTEQITLEKLLQKINEGVYDGATFVPSVSADGVISWTNDRELENPPPVNIKGQKGDKGDKGDRGEQGIQGVQGVKGEKGEQGERGLQGIQGIQGEKGEQGERGADGTSATHSWSGTTLYITSASGTSSANLKGEKGDTGEAGKDGTNGEDGYTPVKGVDYFDGVDGKDGKDGEDGYTPVKGIDYFTDADKQEMVNSVISALPKYDGEVIEV